MSNAYLYERRKTLVDSRKRENTMGFPLLTDDMELIEEERRIRFEPRRKSDRNGVACLPQKKQLNA